MVRASGFTVSPLDRCPCALCTFAGAKIRDTEVCVCVCQRCPAVAVYLFKAQIQRGLGVLSTVGPCFTTELLHVSVVLEPSPGFRFSASNNFSLSYYCRDSSWI